MQRIFSLALVVLAFMAAPADAATDDDSLALAGNWISESRDGVFTQLEIEVSGKFVFRELHSRDLRRSYMCGTLSDGGDALSLRVQQFKERSRSGQIAQAVGGSSETFVIRSRSERRLILQIDSRTVVLDRA